MTISGAFNQDCIKIIAWNVQGFAQVDEMLLWYWPYALQNLIKSRLTNAQNLFGELSLITRISTLKPIATEPFCHLSQFSLWI